MAGAGEGYGPEDVNCGRYYKAVLKVGKKVFKDIIVAMFYRVSVYAGESPTNLKELFSSVLKFSSGHLRKTFSAVEISILKEDLLTANTDITLGFKVISQLGISFPDIFSKLKILKDLRNKLCHEDEVMDSTRLAVAMQDFKDLLTEILENFGDFISESFVEKIKNYADEVDAIHTAPIHDDFSSYMNGLYKFRNELKGKIISKGRQELMNLYSKFCILNPCSWLSDTLFPDFTIDKIYTPLKIVSGSQVFHIEDLLEDMMYKDIGNLRGMPNVICMVGLPGAGKTALCLYILQEWCRGSDKIKNLDLLDLILHVEIRHIRSNDMVSFLRNHLLKETSQEFQKEDLVPILLETNLMIILDGMDECTSQSRKVVEEFFITFGQERILITCRQEYQSDVRNLANDLRLSNIFVQVFGFSSDSLHLFIKKAFKAIELDEEKCKKDIGNFSLYIESTGQKLGSLLDLPLNVILLLILWHQKSDRVNSVTTATRLYHELFLLCKEKLVVRLKNSGNALRCEKNVMEFMKYLGEIALEMLQQDVLILDTEYKNQLIEKCDLLSIDSTQTLSSFLSGESHGALEVHYTFAFLHKSQMEYFAGLYITETFFSKFGRDRVLDEGGVMAKCLRITSFIPYTSRKVYNPLDILAEGNCRKYLNVILYIIGHLVIKEKMTDRNAKLIVKHLKEKVKIPPGEIITWWQVLWEAEKHKCIGNALSGLGIKDSVTFEDFHLKDKSSPELQFVLFTNQRVDIRIELSSSVFPEGVSDSLAGLKLIENKYPGLVELCRYLKNVQEEVTILFNYHYYTWGDMMFNDSILSTFMPRGSLEFFSGHLGKEGIRLLGHTKIRNLYIRVSSPEVLMELVHALNKVTALEVLELLIDFIPTNMDLPAIKQKCKISVKLRGTTDDLVPSTLKILTSLRNTYDCIEFVTSQLTAHGGEQLLTQLLRNGIRICTAVVIRSRHSPLYDNIEELEKSLNCNIDWWW